MASDPLKIASSKLRHAWIADGLADIGVGVILLLPAFWEWGKVQIDPHSRAWQALNWGMMLSIIAAPWLLRWLLPRLRNWFLGDRAGQEIPRAAPEHKRKGAVAAGVAAVAAMAVVVLLARERSFEKGLVALVALGSALLLCQIGWQAAVRRYFVLAVAFVGLGAAVVAWTSHLSEALIWEFGGMGVLMIAAGALALFQWLARNPPRTEPVP